MTDRDLYPITEARKRLGGISRNSIYAMLRSGQLASVLIGCRRFIPAASITELIAKVATTVSPSMDSGRRRTPLQPSRHSATSDSRSTRRSDGR